MDMAELRALVIEGDECARCRTAAYEPDEEFPGICTGCKTVGDEANVAAWAQTTGDDLLRAVREFIEGHITLRTAEYYDLLAVYVLHTHVYEAKRVTPYILALSPIKGSGKTTLLEILLMLCARAWMEVDPAAIATADDIAATRPTMLIDEIDGIWSGSGKDKAQLRSIINAGNHRRGAIKRRRKGVPTRINVYCPKVLAGIENFTLSDTTRDRCIGVILHKQTKAEAKKRQRITDKSEEEAGVLHEWATRWAKANFGVVETTYPTAPSHLHGREWDKWEPLFCVAAIAGGQWPQTVEDMSLALVPEEDEDEKVVLLRDVQKVFKDAMKPWLRTDAIVHALNVMEDSPWGFYLNKGLTAHSFSKLVRAFGLKSEQKRVEGHNVRGYPKAAFTQLWKDYL